MKKVYTLALSLFVAGSVFGQTSLNYKTNMLRPGDVRNLKQVEYQDQGEGGSMRVWDFSKAKDIKDMVLVQAENWDISSNSNDVFLACDEGGLRTTYFEISKTQKMYYGLETPTVKIRFNEPIVDLKFPFSYGEKISGLMNGNYIEGEKTNPIKGTYTTEADAWGTLILPDGNVYNDALRIKVDKEYVQTFQDITGENQEYSVSSIRYQYFVKGVRYPVLIVIESDAKADCGCACSSKVREMYYATPTTLFGESGDDILSENGETIIGNFEYNVSPNPFNDDLHITFSLKKNAKMEINLLDMNGKIAYQVVNEKLQNGNYTYDANTTNIIAGQYVLQIKANDQVYSTKLVKK